MAFAFGQNDARFEGAGRHRGAHLKALLHHSEGVVVSLLREERARPEVEQRDERGILRDKYVQAGVRRSDVIPTQQVVEQPRAVAPGQVGDIVQG